MRPLWVTVALHLGVGFGWRRRVVQAWSWWSSDNAWHRLTFRLRHPVLMAEVDRRARLLRQGIGVLDA